MVFSNLKSTSVLTVTAFVILAFGSGLAVVGLQQQQSTQSQASTSPNNSECNTQYGNASNPRCCSVTYPGGMCKYTNEACPGNFIDGSGGYTTWYCPKGNDYVCCKNAQPSANAGADVPVDLTTANTTTLNGSCSDADQDSRNLKSCTWTKESGPDGGSLTTPSAGNTGVTDLQAGTYVFKLTAADGYASTSDTVNVTVKPPVVAPTIKLSLDLLLHGIGKAGDSMNPGAAGGGNPNPEHKKREVTVGVYTTGTTPVRTKKGNVEYNNESGSFKGVIDMGDLAAGQYIVKVKFSQSLNTQIGEIQNLQIGTNNLPQTGFVTGDITNDNTVSVVNVSDYNIFFGCFSTVEPARSCTDEQKVQSDLDDDKDVDDFDFNLFIRELTHITR